MILYFLIICIPLLLLLSVAVVQLTKAIQILFFGKEEFIGGIGGVFLLIKIIWDIKSEQYKKSYDRYILKTMKASAILSLIFSPIVILGVLYAFFIVFRSYSPI
jgi:hypothetical protein